jgi:hypothetical protein
MMITTNPSSVFVQSQNTSDPQYGKALLYYDLSSPDEFSRFACQDAGARCVFTRSSYESVDFGGGQETENIQGAVWSPLTDLSSTFLTLGPCDAEIPTTQCIVECNANCTCVASTDETFASTAPCDKLSARPPTPAPTQAPTVPQCPEPLFTAFCPELMTTRLPAGNEKNFDCYNFCGGVFVSSCVDGTCGKTECDNATATGTMEGIVKGCTYEHFEQGVRQQEMNEGKSSSTSTLANRGFVGGLMRITAWLVCWMLF